jgi:cell division protein FtsN
LLFSSSSSAALVQASDGATNPQGDSSKAGTTPVISKDSLSSKVDTLHNYQDTTVAARKDTLDIIVGNEGLNTIAGYRVQIGSTQDLSEAISERAEAETILNDYNVYIVYDSPYYKVRAGDFRARYDATQAANYINTHGFTGAWIVPDNVFKNPRAKNSPKDPGVQNR